MLELRPNCEYCDRDLPPNSTHAMICSYECTFCNDCVTRRLNNVCPNCGGGFSPRPIRPHLAHRPGVSLDSQPPSNIRKITKYTADEISNFVKTISHIAAVER